MMINPARWSLRLWPARRTLTAVAAIAVTVGAFVGAASVPASADTSPPAHTPATVSADGLPTVQIDGVVWAQAIVGETVYAGGSFATARPAGSAPGKNTTLRTDLLAYDLSTGTLITSFNHVLNGQVLAVAASPDGSRLYVGGDFTTIDGVPHPHLAVFDTKTGSLINTFSPAVSNQVAAIVATATTIYVGGTFQNSGSVRRSNAAAFTLTGMLLPWNPSPDAAVTALTLSPDKSLMVVGGHFTTLGGQTRLGLGGVDLASGLATTWSANMVIRDFGINAAITSLIADSVNVYVTGYVFFANGGQGNFEGRAAINPYTGTVVWIDDCHGDSYSSFPVGQVLYSVSHSHQCYDVGAFLESMPETWHRAIADTTYATGTLKHNIQKPYFDFGGQPSPTQLDWYPDLAAGSYTGAFQGGWTITGNSTYLLIGGEFPKVNGVAQQGLVRFVVPSQAPNKIGPKVTAAFTPMAKYSSAAAGVTVTWGAAWDPDNSRLSYTVLRDAAQTPVTTLSMDSRFWTAPTEYSRTPPLYGTAVDTTAPPGVHTYRIKVADPYGNSVVSPASNTVTVSGNDGSGGPTAFGADAFDRTVTSGLGAADVGGSWTLHGPMTAFSVRPGAAALTMTPGQGPSADLISVARTDASISVDFTTDKIADQIGVYGVIVDRRERSGDEYLTKVRISPTGQVGLALSRIAAGVETPLAPEAIVSGLTVTAGTWITVRTEIHGSNPSTVRARAWKAGATEPNVWPVAASDKAPGLQAAGQVGFGGFLSAKTKNGPVTLRIRAFLALPS